MTSRREIVLSVGEQGVIDRLHDERDAIAALERKLAQRKHWRALLIRKLRHAGLPIRFIEQHAGVSNVAVLQIVKRLEAEEEAS